MIRTFVDAGVLIDAARGTSPLAALASDILVNAGRQFVSSNFVRLEVVPKPTYHHRSGELAFCNAFFAAVYEWVPVTSDLVELALLRASEFGLGAFDALHIAAAEIAMVDELVTAEKPDKPICRVTSIRVISIHP